MKVFNKLIMGILCAGASFACLAAVEVGQVSYVRGVVTGQIDGQQPRIIGKGIGLHNGETLNTGSRAFALIKFDDGTKMTLRPTTTFWIEHVKAQQDSDNELVRLTSGCPRALTGPIL